MIARVNDYRTFNFLFLMFLIQRYLTKERHCHIILYIASVLDSCIEEEFRKEPHSRNCKTEKETEQKNLGPVWSNRAIASCNIINDLSIIVNHCLSQGILFSLIEQEHVKSLLNLLLTFNRKKFTLFLRHREHSSQRITFLTLGFI